MTPKVLTEDNKPHYRAWCALLINEWQREGNWGQAVGKAENANIPLGELPTTPTGFISYKSPLRAVVANHFPVLSKKLFDANDKADLGLVLLWLMQHPQMETISPKKERNADAALRQEVRKGERVIRAQRELLGEIRDSHHAGGHVPVRGTHRRCR